MDGGEAESRSVGMLRMLSGLALESAASACSTSPRPKAEHARYQLPRSPPVICAAIARHSPKMAIPADVGHSGVRLADTSLQLTVEAFVIQEQLQGSLLDRSHASAACLHLPVTGTTTSGRSAAHRNSRQSSIRAQDFCWSNAFSRFSALMRIAFAITISASSMRHSASLTFPKLNVRRNSPNG